AEQSHGLAAEAVLPVPPAIGRLRAASRCAAGVVHERIPRNPRDCREPVAFGSDEPPLQPAVHVGRDTRLALSCEPNADRDDRDENEYQLFHCSPTTARRHRAVNRMPPPNGSVPILYRDDTVIDARSTTTTSPIPD